MKKLYVTDMDGLERIVRVVKKGRPPKGMTRKEWYRELSETLIREQGGAKLLREIYDDAHLGA